MTKFLNISTDNTLGGSSASDEVVSSQKALKTYIDNHSGGGGSYTAGTGIDITSNTISVDFDEVATASQGALADSAVQPEYLSTVATSGSYTDLSNKPTIPSMNSSNNYVPYRSSSSAFSNSTLMYNSNAMAFTGKLHIGSTSPANYSDKGRLSIYDNQSNTQVSSLALLNYGGGGGCGVAIDMYNTSANGGIPSGRIGVVDNGNYSGYLQLKVKKSGAQSNPLLPAMNVVPIPAPNSTTTCVSFGQDEFNRVLFDLHRTESYITISDADKRWSGSGTTYYVSGTEKFTQRLMVAVGDIVYFNSGTEATVTSVTSSASQLQITTDVTLGSVSSKSLFIKKAYMRISDESNNTKLALNPYGKLGIGTVSPTYDLDVVGNINASTDVKVNGSSVALASQLPSLMTGADGTNAGTSGLVPTPSATDNTKFLRGDATFASAIIPSDVKSEYNSSGTDPVNGTAITGALNTMRSNCITEIPQDINLTLSNGTLTLKAGSVITLADGRQKVCESDITFTSSTNGESLVYANTNGTWMQSRLVSKSVSGDIRPLTDTYMMWFDTANQAVYTYGNDPSSGLLVSLPFAKITVTNGAISSIDQVFNGAGYIGSSVFVLPGVKCLVPNGFNEDGTLKSKLYTTTNLRIRTDGGNNNPYFGLDTDYGTISIASSVSYDEKENKVIWSGNKVTNRFLLLKRIITDGVVTQFDVLQPVRLATTEMLDKKANDSDVVHKSGDTMTGPLSISYDNNALRLTNPNITKGTTPSTNKQTTIMFNDSSDDVDTPQNTLLGAIVNRVMADGSSSTEMRVYKNEASSSTPATISVIMDSAGNASCEFPNTTCVDGGYVETLSPGIVSGVSLNGTTDLEYTLSELPNDGQNYLACMIATVTTGSTSGNNVMAQLYSTICPSSLNVSRAITRTSSNMSGTGTCWLPVGSDRKIKLGRSSNYNGTCNLYFRGYRRMGTNS